VLLVVNMDEVSVIHWLFFDRSFFHFVTMHAFDRRTDGQTAFSSLYRVCIPCSAVKKTAARNWHAGKMKQQHRKHTESLLLFYSVIFIKKWILYERNKSLVANFLCCNVAKYY